MKGKDQGRNSFVFYRSFFQSINSCPAECQLALYRAVVEYALDDIPPTFSGSQYAPFMTAIWSVIVPQIDANTRRYLNGCKGAQYGVRGGAPTGNQNARKQPQNNPKTTPNVNVNENVNDNENEKLVLPYDSQEFRKTWELLRKQPKWAKKSRGALSKTLEQFAKYPEPFVLELMNTAIANGYQGAIFGSTPQDFERWKRTHPDTTSTNSKPITSFDDL